MIPALLRPLRLCAASLVLAAALLPGAPAPAAAQGTPSLLPPTSTNLQVATASYVGSGGASATAVDVAPDGTTVLGGLVASEPVGPGEPASPVTAPVTSLLGGGPGLVVRLGAGGGNPGVLSSVRLPAAVEDVKVNGSGQIAACGDFGVVVLDGTATALVWADRPGPVRRCAFADDGTLAALVGASVVVYGPTGAHVATWSAGGTVQSDVAIDGQRGLVFATGHSNRRTAQGEPVQVAFLRAWTFAGAPVWTAYDTPADRLAGALADTRGVRVTLGRDGRLYFAAESAGGNSLFGRQPRNGAARLRDDQLVQTDVFTNASFNTPRNHITWFGRYNPLDGSLERGQFVLARLDDANLRGNTIRPRAIAADEEGRVYLVGATNASIQDRDTRTISGTAVGPYRGGEAFLLVVQPDLRRRVVWTTFTAPTPNGNEGTHDSVATGIGVRNGIAALAATVARGALVTFNQLPAGPAGASAPNASSIPATPTAPPAPATAGATAQATPSGSGSPPVATAPATVARTPSPPPPSAPSPLSTVATAPAPSISVPAPATPSQAPAPAGPSVPPAVAGVEPLARAYVAVWSRSGESAESGPLAPPAPPATPGSGVSTIVLVPE